jgi:hypothetical protein
MHSTVMRTCAVLCLALASGSPQSAKEKSALAKRFAPVDLRADLHIMRQGLEAGSPGLYRHTSKQAFDKAWLRAEGSLRQPLRASEFFRVAAPLIAAIKNGHTQLRLPAAEAQDLEETVPLFPLGVRVLGQRIFVVRDFSGEAETLAGSEIRAINGVIPRVLIERLLTAVSADGDVETSRRRIISGWGFIQRLHTILGFQTPFILSLRDSCSPRDFTRVVNGVPGALISKEWKDLYPRDLEAGNRRFFDFRFSDDDRIGIMTIPSWDDFVDSDHKTTIQEFFHSAFTAIQERAARALIIDVRDNGGGEDSYGTLLASYLLDKPFEYFTDIWMKGLSFDFLRYSEPSYRIGTTNMLPKEITDLSERWADGRYHLTKRPNWGTQQLSAPGFKGRVYVLINGNSFSASTEFSAFLWSRRRAEFVGEEASGYWRSNTSGPSPTLTLPATKLRLTVPLVEFDLAVTDGTPGAHGVKPDHEVTYTVEDLVAGTDKDMAVALRLAGAEQPSAEPH